MAIHVLACGMSRSGTTLLTTILDSHPDISMGYELLPVDLPPVADIIKLLDAAIEKSEGNSNACGDLLRAKDFKPLGTFVKRCARTLTTAQELRDICCAFESEGCDSFDGLEMRTRLSLAVVQNKMRKEETTSCGFKINSPSISAFDSVIPDGRFIYILRDPRDVVASHFANDFDRTLEHICKAWVNYVEKFDAFAQANPDRAYLVRYEDLVARPEKTLKEALGQIGVPFASQILRFFDSKASVHRGGHVNSDNLRKNFYSTSIARWQRDLSIDQIKEIQLDCGALMERHGYVAAPTATPVPMPPKLREQMAEKLAGKKRFGRALYAEMLEPFLSDYVNLTWHEAAAGEKARGRNILLLRHDVDHDIDTALKIAKWEQQRELRATYCILHTAWYYGEATEHGFQRYQFVLDACQEIQSLGHEINLHNNVAAIALRTGQDPIELLQQETMFLRIHGLNITGTSTHGDRICRELDFRNFELFSECVYEERGGPRTIRHEGHSVELGAVSMHDLWLAYEAYDIPRDLYLSDSGGELRTNPDTFGRGGKLRDQLEYLYPYAKIVGILTHPVWWDFQRDTIPPASDTNAVQCSGSLPSDTST